jgi:hypothetical protein
LVLSHTDTLTFDDAGGGNILGGLVIGALRGECYRSRIIGPEWFSFGSALPPLISSTVIEMVGAYGSPRSVRLCRSHLFDQSARDLARLGHEIERGAIEGELQTRTERDFFHHLIEIGLPAHILRLFPDSAERKPRCYRSLNEFCTAFLMADPDSRSSAAKTVGSIFSRIAAAEIERVYCERLKGRPRRCVECGEPVAGEAYRCEGAGRIFYVHRECARWVS